MEEKLKFIIANCCQLDPSEIKDDAGVNHTPNWDSLVHIDIMACIEQEFDISLDTKTITALITYRDILMYLKDFG